MFQFPPPFTDGTEKNIHVIVETPKGSRYKYAWQPQYGLYLLKRTMPVGVTFPHDFGFVPHTLAEDGDPLDALVLSGAPVAVGALITCRVLGILEAEQVDEPDAKPIRNDRLICTPLYNPEFDAIETIADLGKEWLNDLVRFFNFYRSRTGGSFKLVANRGPEAALRAIHKAIQAGAKLKENVG